MEEEEVITFKEFIERNKDMKEDELLKIVLVCKNCGHKDLLGNFIKKIERSFTPYGDLMDTQITPISPKPYKPPYKPYKPKWDGWKINYQQKQKTNKIMSLVRMNDGKRYEDYFFCPKCHSSLVVLCNDFVKNNLLRGLDK